MLGMGAFMPSLPLFIRELGVFDAASQKRWSGLVQAAPLLSLLIATPIWGIVADKYGKKIMVVRAFVGLSLAIFLIGLVRNVYELFALRLLQGFISGFVSACLGLVSSGTPERHSGFAIGILQTSLSFGLIGGPFLGGIISDAFGMRTLCVMVSSLCIVSGIVVGIFVKEDPPDRTTPMQLGFFKTLHFGILHRPSCFILLSLVLASAGMMFTSPIMTYYVESLSAPSDWVATLAGAVMGTTAICTTVSAPLWGRLNDREGIKRTLSITAPLLALALAAQGLVPNYLFLFPLRALVGLLAGGLVPTLLATMAKSSTPDQRGAMMGLASSANTLGNLLGPILCGQLAALFGMRICFFAAALMVGAIYFLLSRLSLVKEQGLD